MDEEQSAITGLIRDTTGVLADELSALVEALEEETLTADQLLIQSAASAIGSRLAVLAEGLTTLLEEPVSPEVALLQAQIAVLQAQIGDLNDQLGDLNDQLAQVISQKNALLATVNGQSTQIEQLLAESRQQANDLADMLDSRDGLQVLLDECLGDTRPEPTDPPTGVTLATDIETITSGPYPIEGFDYTGLQLGPLYEKPGGGRWGENYPAYTRPQGQYEGGWADVVGLENGLLRVTMKREGHPYYAATTDHQQHLPFDLTEMLAGYPNVAYEFAFRRVSDEDFLTEKLGGPIAFDGNWDQWPGGGANPGFNNYSARAVLNSAYSNRRRFAMYLYLGADNAATNLVINGTEGKGLHFSNNNRTVEITALNGPEVLTGVLYKVRIEAYSGTPGQANGRLRYLVRPEGEEWAEIMTITNIKWAETGSGLWVRGYVNLMFGGRDIQFAPQNPEMRGILDFGQLKITEIGSTLDLI